MRRSAIAIFIAFFAVYQLNGRPHAEVDCVASPFEVCALVQHGSFDLRPYPELSGLVGFHVRELPDGAWVSARSPGAALTALPVIAPFALLGDPPFSANGMLTLGKVVGSICVAASAVLFFITCRRIAPAAAWPATILFGLGTCLCSVASQALWMHGPATFWLCAALALLTAERSDRFSWSAAAGFALGFAVLARPSTAFFALASGTSLVIERRWREAAGLAVGSAVPLGFLCILNTFFFGDPVLGGYAVVNWNQKPPLWLGLGGLLIAPSRGMLVYSPALLLTLWGVRYLFGRADSYRTLLSAWAVAGALTVLFYARWCEWRGGWCYGPRLLCETMPIFCLLFAVGYERLRAGWPRRAASALVALSVTVHLVGLFGYGGSLGWHQRHERSDGGRCLFETHDTQIEAHVRAVLNQLAGHRGESP